MTLELGLLVLESVLLVATVVLLVLSLREGRGRDRLIMEVDRATRVLTRHEYFLTVTDTMTDARREVIGCITGRLPVGGDSKRIQQVAYSIERLTKAGVRVRYTLPKFQDRLYVGWLYRRAGAEVHYRGCPHFHDFRYIVVDGEVTVVGIPESTGDKEATKRGYRIPSAGFAAILREHFFACWSKNVPFEDFVRETIQQTGTSPAVLARELGIDAEELTKLAAQ